MEPRERLVGSGSTQRNPEGATMSAAGRTLNLLLGGWLFVSSWFWPHETAQFNNAWICGLVTVVLALIAYGIPPVRFLNTLLAIWLFISAFALPHVSATTVWNNALVAVAIFVVSLVGPAFRGTHDQVRRTV